MHDTDRQGVIDALRRHHLRATEQRLSIIEALKAEKSHPSAEQLCQILRQHHPTISLSTVYKTLQALAKIGIVQTIETPCGRQRFDGQENPHHHAVCSCCNGVFDVPTEALPVSIPQIDRIGNFRIDSVKVYLIGRCADCCRQTGG